MEQAANPWSGVGEESSAPVVAISWVHLINAVLTSKGKKSLTSVETDAWQLAEQGD